MRGWRRMSGDVNDDDDNSSESYHLSFPRLSELVISQCSRVGSNHSIEFPPLSMLKYVQIGGYDLNVEKLPKDWVRNLTSLKKLVFYKLPDRKFQETGIWFKNGRNYLPFLENINFLECGDLESLPEWICNFSSLHSIFIQGCEDLASLPEGMTRLAKLQTLQIVGCPLLIEECIYVADAIYKKLANVGNVAAIQLIWLSQKVRPKVIAGVSLCVCDESVLLDPTFQ
ncbi:disease resistance protein (CC-NBS-LRR class) family protein [Trifolium medium]|uniref:Disease resistance protein (CC-NBS-LRR class) family protein n=1 Tax=Trifolium medium TaxID=97028 RepID=A0A392M7F1_9FABA|nr:disease resistance protein (CC-NBS-LRR class) family protein [Trifolium medium]